MQRRILACAGLSLLLLSACSWGSRGRVKRDVVVGTEELEMVMVNKDTARHPQHGLEQWFAVGAISGVEGIAANGVADSHVFEDGATVVTVNLNIYEPPKGSTYVGWVRKPGATEKIRLGTFERPFSDVRHRLTGEVEEDLTGYTEVLVTLEKNSGVTESDPVQATGLMKQRQR